MNVKHQFKKIDKLLLQIGDFLIKDNQKIVIHTVFENIVDVVSNIIVNTKHHEEKQQKIKQFVGVLNQTKSKNIDNQIIRDTYSHLLQDIIDLYLWLMDINTPKS